MSQSKKTGVFYIVRARAGAELLESLLRTQVLDRCVLITGLDAPVPAVPADLADRFRVVSLRELLRPAQLDAGQLADFRAFEQGSACGSGMQWVMGTRWLVMQTFKGAYYVRRPGYGYGEIEQITHAAFVHVRALLAEEDPELVFIENIGNLATYILAELAHGQGRRTLYFAPIRFGKGLAFANTAYENCLPVYRGFLAARQQGRAALGEASWQRAEKRVAELQRAVIQFHDAAQMSGRGHTEQVLKRASLLRKLPKLFGLGGKRPVSSDAAGRQPSLVRAPNPRTAALRLAQTRLRRRFAELGGVRFDTPQAGERYVFFALHSEPETALSLNTPWLQDQASFVANLAYSVPVGTWVYVKDHPRMFGLRPLGYYEEMARAHPNVRVLDPRANALELVRSASAVVTAAGTAGLEGLLLGIPAVTLGACLYQHVRGVESVMDIAGLPQALVRAVNGPHDREAIAADALKFLAACFDRSAEIGWFSDLANGNTRYDYAGEEFRRFAAFFTAQVREALGDDAWIAPMRTGLDVREPLFAA